MISLKLFFTMGILTSLVPSTITIQHQENSGIDKNIVIQENTIHSNMNKIDIDSLPHHVQNKVKINVVKVSNTITNLIYEINISVEDSYHSYNFKSLSLNSNDKFDSIEHEGNQVFLHGNKLDLNQFKSNTIRLLIDIKRNGNHDNNKFKLGYDGNHLEFNHKWSSAETEEEESIPMVPLEPALPVPEEGETIPSTPLEPSTPIEEDKKEDKPYKPEPETKPLPPSKPVNVLEEEAPKKESSEKVVIDASDKEKNTREVFILKLANNTSGPNGTNTGNLNTGNLGNSNNSTIHNNPNFNGKSIRFRSGMYGLFHNGKNEVFINTNELENVPHIDVTKDYVLEGYFDESGNLFDASNIQSSMYTARYKFVKPQNKMMITLLPFIISLILLLLRYVLSKDIERRKKVS